MAEGARASEVTATTPPRRPAEGAPLELTTARLRLRLPTAADGGVFGVITEDEQVQRYITGAAQPPHVKYAWIERFVRCWRELGFERWLVESREDGRLIGYGGLHYLDGGPEIEVGYGLVPSEWGKGYATEVARAAVGWGFEVLGLDRIVAVAYPANLPSQHVMEKLGMTYVGKGHWYGHDLHQFAITREEWGRRGARAPRQELPALPGDAPRSVQTRRLHLRAPREDDIDHFAAMWADPDVERYLRGTPQTREASEQRLSAWMDKWRSRGWGEWVVELRGYGTILGYCGLEDLDSTGEVQVSYGFAKQHWGKGYATEGALASLAWGFAHLSLDHIVGVANHDNLASLRVLEKAGLRYQKDGTWYGKPMRYLAISRALWGARPPGHGNG
ncbi:MAG: GNAT family N-acetyltransferase [Candidatus Dormibacteraeota bacterium]|nr:GNAT family N-acetyltransferase [Candidatus Dormibacteraeota bacterium]